MNLPKTRTAGDAASDAGIKESVALDETGV
jgi:hypothetical protein